MKFTTEQVREKLGISVESMEFLKSKGIHSLVDEEGYPLDKLDLLFALQGKFDNELIEKRENLKAEKEKISNEKEFRDLWTQRIANALANEVEELRDETSWKWWKNPKEFEEEEAFKELIDIMHFAPSGIIRLGYDAKDTFLTYLTKNAENYARQNGTSKDIYRKGYEIGGKSVEIKVEKIDINTYDEVVDGKSVGIGSVPKGTRKGLRVLVNDQPLCTLDGREETYQKLDKYLIDEGKDFVSITRFADIPGSHGYTWFYAGQSLGFDSTNDFDMTRETWLELRKHI